MLYSLHMISKNKCNAVIALITISFIFLFSSVHGEPSCTAKDNNCIQKEKEFRKADKELNDVYRSLQKNLNATLKEDMKKGSIEWIGYKEYLCNYDLEMRNQNKNGDAQYFSCLYDLTASRTKYLKNVYGTKHSPAIKGTYNDGVGGNLVISKSGQNWKLSISVVRGPTYHTGEVSGDFIMKDQQGFFEIKEDGLSCTLEILQKTEGIEIVEKECSDFHGARAYFTGLYRKMKD